MRLPGRVRIGQEFGSGVGNKALAGKRPKPRLLAGFGYAGASTPPESNREIFKRIAWEKQECGNRRVFH
jgi:hypothetical protein